MLYSSFKLLISLSFSANLFLSSFNDFSNLTSSDKILFLRFSFTSLMLANAIIHLSEHSFSRT
ncbi:hypothetical protein HanHA300_Chr10g0357411 [Helianthus annuus]|nr:hypothetical protein HanHA300_Chr10g0357411 [Helianthus annuus]KAJ0521267.1 hypothetical protein HanIR_Chr10g0468901 [Helianthus annuus]KAJ0529538.1 hypothetical protein HanHA89_Chr10g0379021 [Helianthus annuus]KAJ0696423.1 hypothetical protein HanLR1_Chr10g0356921 [Helianthus annuus]